MDGMTRSQHEVARVLVGLLGERELEPVLGAAEDNLVFRHNDETATEFIWAQLAAAIGVDEASGQNAGQSPLHW